MTTRRILKARYEDARRVAMRHAEAVAKAAQTHTQARGIMARAVAKSKLDMARRLGGKAQAKADSARVALERFEANRQAAKAGNKRQAPGILQQIANRERGQATLQVFRAGVPTDERIAKAGDGMEAGDLTRTYKALTWPLERLRARRLLCPGKEREDAERNQQRFDAGERYYTTWYGAGLSAHTGNTLAGLNGGGSGDPAHAMPTSEYAARCRSEHRLAVAAVPRSLLMVLDAIVLDETDVVEVGRRASGYEKPHAAGAVALDRLRMALDLLIEFYGGGSYSGLSASHQRDNRPRAAAAAKI